MAEISIDGNTVNGSCGGPIDGVNYNVTIGGVFVHTDGATSHGAKLIPSQTSVTINEKPILRVGDAVTPHTVGDKSHGGVITGPASNVTISG